MRSLIGTKNQTAIHCFSNDMKTTREEGHMSHFFTFEIIEFLTFKGFCAFYFSIFVNQNRFLSKYKQLLKVISIFNYLY